MVQVFKLWGLGMFDFRFATHNDHRMQTELFQIHLSFFNHRFNLRFRLYTNDDLKSIPMFKEHIGISIWIGKWCPEKVFVFAKNPFDNKRNNTVFLSDWFKEKILRRKLEKVCYYCKGTGTVKFKTRQGIEAKTCDCIKGREIKYANK